MTNLHPPAEAAFTVAPPLPTTLPAAPSRPRPFSGISIRPFSALLKYAIAQIYPQLCLSCGANHIHIHDILCLKCHLNLPETHFHTQLDNKFTERLWGRLPLLTGASLYAYQTLNRSSGVKRLIHRLKYERCPEIGRALGKYYGRQLSKIAHYQSVDCIIPVPLHRRKLRMRGYNQSNEFAKGLAHSLNIPYHSQGLIRRVFTKTQTKKSRFERFDNVAKVFEIGEIDLQNKHILLVDDVLTTGATLEACGLALAEVTGIKLSMATIAMAMR